MTIMMRFCLFLFLSTTTAFIVVTQQSNRPLFQKLSEIDEICIENVAEFCVDTQDPSCDVEEYEALLNQLRDHRQQLHNHMNYIDSLIEKLQNGDTKTVQTYFAG